MIKKSALRVGTVYVFTPHNSTAGLVRLLDTRLWRFEGPRSGLHGTYRSADHGELPGSSTVWSSNRWAVGYPAAEGVLGVLMNLELTMDDIVRDGRLRAGRLPLGQLELVDNRYLSEWDDRG